MTWTEKFFPFDLTVYSYQTELIGTALEWLDEQTMATSACLNDRDDAARIESVHQFLLQSVLIRIHTATEEMLRQACVAVDDRSKVASGEAAIDPTRWSIDESKDCLTFAGIDWGPISGTWSAVRTIADVRHSIAHANGRIEGGRMDRGMPSRLKKLDIELSPAPGPEFWCEPRTKAQVVLKTTSVERCMTTSGEFASLLFAGVRKWWTDLRTAR